MSAFGNYEKDNIVDAIKLLAEKEFELNKTPREIIASIMEATSYGINDALYGLRHMKVDDAQR